jgi:hypothetical protein
MYQMNAEYADILLALAAIVVPLAVAALLVELRSRQEIARGRRHPSDARNWSIMNHKENWNAHVILKRN